MYIIIVFYSEDKQLAVAMAVAKAVSPQLTFFLKTKEITNLLISSKLLPSLYLPPPPFLPSSLPPSLSPSLSFTSSLSFPPSLPNAEV